jgi:hypothetical protein
MTSRELKRLNHYPEFRTNAGITNIIDFISEGVFPQGLNTRQRTRYNAKFGAGSGFVVRNNNQTLHYNPNANIDLEVVKPNQRQQRIQAVYNDIRRGLGTGLSAFYHQIAMTYLNIPKEITDDFLRSQGDYIIAKVPRKLVNKPITSKVPNERWGVDLIDMTAYPPVGNANKRYILTAVDYFSGKVWARGITNRENNNARPTLSNAINDICVNEAETFPNTIQADGEFAVGAFRDWCNQNNINLIKTTSYTPTSNGKIERMNREVRKKIKAGMIRNNNFLWFANLQAYIENINNQQSSRNSQTPNRLWTQGYNPHAPNHVLPAQQPLNDNMNIQQRQDYQEAFIDNRARQIVSLGRPVPVFQNGDLVRVKVQIGSNRMRQARENNIGWNKIAVHYTPQVFQVIQAFNYPANFVRRDEYILANLDGVVLMSGGVPRRFFANEMVAVPQNHIATHVVPFTIQRADQINRLV